MPRRYGSGKLAVGGGAVDVGVIADPHLDKTMDGGAIRIFAARYGFQKSIDGCRNFRRHFLFLDVFEFPLRGFVFLQVEIGSCNLGASRAVVGLHCQHALECENRLGILAQLQGRRAQQEIVVGIAGTFRLLREQKVVGLLRVAIVEMLLRLQQDIVDRKRRHRNSDNQRQYQRQLSQMSHQSSLPNFNVLHKAWNVNFEFIRLFMVRTLPD